MKIKKKVLFLIFLSFFTGCGEKKIDIKESNNRLSYKNNSIEQLSNEKKIERYFIEQGAKYDINPKTLKAICKHESKLNPYAINVNKTKNTKKELVGTYNFKIKEEAQLFMNVVFDKPELSFDVGYCQINNQHFTKNKLESEDLLNIETNIGLSAKIYKYGVDKCTKEKSSNLLECSLSVYNTGYSNKNSAKGREYAKKVIQLKASL